MMGLGAHDEQGWRKGPWTPEEDKLLLEYVNHHGDGRWSSVAKTTGLKRSGKSCRLRWVNYLRPGLKRGQITPEEEAIIVELHSLWGNKWSTIARYLPGRTDNEIKNYWRTHFKKKEKGSASNKERRKEYQMLKQKQKQEEEQHNQGDGDANDHDHVGASASADNEKINVTLMEEQGMREEVYMCSSDYYNYNWGLEDHIDQCWPEMVPPREDVEEGLWSGLWNLDDSRFGHFTVNNNNNLPNQNFEGVPFSSASSGGDATNCK